jgi:hypothetical protein
MNSPFRAKQFALILTTAAAFVGFVGAQAKIERDHPGKWTVAPPIKAAPHGTVPAAEASSANAWLNQILEVLRRAPMLASPKGFDVIPQALFELDTIDGRLADSAPHYVYGLAEADLAQYEAGPRGAAANSSDAAAAIRIEVNRLGPVIEGAAMDTDVAADDQGAFLQNPPAPDGDFHGYPVYQVNSDRFIVMKRNNVPFFTSVSRERFLRYKIKATQAQLDKAQSDWARNKGMLAGIPNAAEITKTMTDNLNRLQHVVDASKKELVAMPPAQAASPAYVDLSDDSEGVKFVGKDDGIAIVNVNPALMDSKLPRSAPQILTVDIRTDADNWPAIAAQLDQQIDWAALEEILHQ